MFSTMFALFIFTAYTVTADLQFATMEQCEAVRAQIQKPRVAFKTQRVEIQVPKKTLECNVKNYNYNGLAPAIHKITCKEVK